MFYRKNHNNVAILHFKGLGDWLMASHMIRDLRSFIKPDSIYLLWNSNIGYDLGLYYSGVINYKLPSGLLNKFLYILKLFFFNNVRTFIITGRSSSAKLALLKSVFFFIRFYAIDRSASFYYDSNLNTHNSFINTLLLRNAFDVKIPFPSSYFLPYKSKNSQKVNSICIHPGGDVRNKYRRWPISNFIILADLLTDYGYDVSFILGPDESDLAGNLVDYNVISPCSIPELLDYLSIFESLVCSDSGLGHLASSLNLNVFSIFGPADPLHSRPLGLKSHVISPTISLDCMPCVVDGGLRGCSDPLCLSSIHPSYVLSIILENLK